jgi:hypothetical protein
VAPCPASVEASPHTDHDSANPPGTHHDGLRLELLATRAAPPFPESQNTKRARCCSHHLLRESPNASAEETGKRIAADGDISVARVQERWGSSDRPEMSRAAPERSRSEQPAILDRCRIRPSRGGSEHQKVPRVRRLDTLIQRRVRRSTLSEDAGCGNQQQFIDVGLRCDCSVTDTPDVGEQT